MKRGFFGGSSSALRISKIYLRRTSGCTYTPCHRFSRISSWLTRRSACSTKYRRTANTFGARKIRVSSRHRHWLAVSSRNGGKLFISALPALPPSYNHSNSTEIQRDVHRIAASPLYAWTLKERTKRRR